MRFELFYLFSLGLSFPLGPSGLSPSPASGTKEAEAVSPKQRRGQGREQSEPGTRGRRHRGCVAWMWLSFLLSPGRSQCWRPLGQGAEMREPQPDSGRAQQAEGAVGSFSGSWPQRWGTVAAQELGL